jgi:hypothetical protein
VRIQEQGNIFVIVKWPTNASRNQLHLLTL